MIGNSKSNHLGERGTFHVSTDAPPPPPPCLPRRPPPASRPPPTPPPAPPGRVFCFLYKKTAEQTPRGTGALFPFSSRPPPPPCCVTSARQRCIFGPSDTACRRCTRGGHQCDGLASRDDFGSPGLPFGGSGSSYVQKGAGGSPMGGEMAGWPDTQQGDGFGGSGGPFGGLSFGTSCFGASSFGGASYGGPSCGAPSYGAPSGGSSSTLGRKPEAGGGRSLLSLGGSTQFPPSAPPSPPHDTGGEDDDSTGEYTGGSHAPPQDTSGEDDAPTGEYTGGGRAAWGNSSGPPPSAPPSPPHDTDGEDDPMGVPVAGHTGGAFTARGNTGGGMFAPAPPAAAPAAPETPQLFVCRWNESGFRGVYRTGNRGQVRFVFLLQTVRGR